MPEKTTVELFSANDADETTISLEERETDELVIALVGPVGSGVSTTGAEIQSVLENSFNYKVEPIKVSDLIASSANLVGVAILGTESEKERIEKLQDAGTKLREKFGEDYLSEKCIESIAAHRVHEGGFKESEGGELIPVPRRQAYIIDSLKHPHEIMLLNDVYGELFWVFGVFAPKEVRRKRLEGKGVDGADIIDIFKRDEDDDVGHGQKVRDSIQHADFFIRNDGSNTDSLNKSVTRYLKLVFASEIITPSYDEKGMYNASAAAAGSACLSRQVGAAIYSGDGELIGKGRNDVPKATGGLYSCEDKSGDHRCYKWQNRECHNDDRKEALYRDISKSLTKAKLLKKDKDFDEVRDAIRETDVKNLIEFSRAVHAEMDAIISVARSGAPGIVGGTLYCTTFPCHSCARHIVASGISRTVYIEPYPKSLAIQLHNDSIATDEGEGKVTFVQYEGVAPKNMLRLFEYKKDRKENGKAVKIDPTKARPVSRSPLDGFYRREQIVLTKLQEAEGANPG